MAGGRPLTSCLQLRQLCRHHTRPAALCRRRNASSAAAAAVEVPNEDIEDLEQESSFSAAPPSADVIQNYDPIARARSRTTQLPPSRYHRVNPTFLVCMLTSLFKISLPAPQVLPWSAASLPIASTVGPCLTTLRSGPLHAAPSAADVRHHHRLGPHDAHVHALPSRHQPFPGNVPLESVGRRVSVLQEPAVAASAGRRWLAAAEEAHHVPEHPQTDWCDGAHHGEGCAGGQRAPACGGHGPAVDHQRTRHDAQVEEECSGLGLEDAPLRRGDGAAEGRGCVSLSQQVHRYRAASDQGLEGCADELRGHVWQHHVWLERGNRCHVSRD